MTTTDVTTPLLPGRLGNPKSLLNTDPRSDPRMVEAMRPFALDGEPAPTGVDASTRARTGSELMKSPTISSTPSTSSPTRPAPGFSPARRTARRCRS